MVEGKEQTVEITLIKCQGYYSYNSRFLLKRIILLFFSTLIKCYTTNLVHFSKNCSYE